MFEQHKIKKTKNNLKRMKKKKSFLLGSIEQKEDSCVRPWASSSHELNPTKVERPKWD